MALKDDIKKRKPFDHPEEEAFLNLVRTTTLLEGDFERLFKQCGLSDPQYNVIFAPWTAEDGDKFPEGKQIALTHWSVHQPDYDPSFFQGDVESWGESQFCASYSGGALDEFMNRYPYDDAPEGYLWHQGE